MQMDVSIQIWATLDFQIPGSGWEIFNWACNNVVWGTQHHHLVMEKNNSCLAWAKEKYFIVPPFCHCEENMKSKAVEKNPRNSSKIYSLLILMHLAFSVLKHSLVWEKFLLSLTWKYNKVWILQWPWVQVLETACCNAESLYVGELCAEPVIWKCAWTRLCMDVDMTWASEQYSY